MANYFHQLSSLLFNLQVKVSIYFTLLVPILTFPFCYTHVLNSAALIQETILKSHSVFLVGKFIRVHIFWLISRLKSDFQPKDLLRRDVYRKFISNERKKQEKQKIHTKNLALWLSVCVPNVIFGTILNYIKNGGYTLLFVFLRVKRFALVKAKLFIPSQET